LPQIAQPKQEKHHVQDHHSNLDCDRACLFVCLPGCTEKKPAIGTAPAGSASKPESKATTKGGEAPPLAEVKTVFVLSENVPEGEEIAKTQKETKQVHGGSWLRVKVEEVGYGRPQDRHAKLKDQKGNKIDQQPVGTYIVTGWILTYEFTPFNNGGTFKYESTGLNGGGTHTTSLYINYASSRTSQPQ
jgi:hypothetical protein